MKFRYNCSYSWFKGNTHTHTSMSDGGRTTEEVRDLYKSCGYDFLFITDHNYAEDTSPYCLDSFLVLPGIEIDGIDRDKSYYHIQGLDFDYAYDPHMPLDKGIEFLFNQGAIVILAHPHWSNNSFDDCLKYPFHGVEIFNYIAHTMNGKSIALAHWDMMIDQGKNVLGFASDDAHLTKRHPYYGGGWIKVNAPALNRKYITSAIQKGNFYSSTGPEFRNISLKGDILSVETSPVRFIRLAGQNGFAMFTNAEEGEELTSHEFSLANIKGEEPKRYLRIEIEDAANKRAWTNTLFA